MALTIREALELSAFRDADARVLAGSANLDRPVRWVHVAELSDIAPLLKGAELLLTTGMGLVESPAVRRRYINQLADAEVAGLVVELGRNFGQMPAEMIQTAERRGIPLIALEHETRFVEVTEQVHRAILSRQYELLDRVEAMNRDFTSLILGGAGIQQILHKLCDAVGNPVILENTAHQVVGFSPQDSDTVEETLAEWDQHSRTDHQEVGQGTVHRAAGSQPCTWVGIWLHHEPWGRIHVLHTTEKGDEITGLMLDRAGVALGLAVLSQKDADNLADRAASAVIADLVSGRFGSSEELLRRARSLGSDLSDRVLVAIMVEPMNLTELADEQGLTEQARQQVRIRLRAQLRGILAGYHCTALLGLDGDRILAIAAVPRRSELPQLLEQVAKSLRSRAAESNPALVVVIAASRETRADSLQQAFAEARVAIEFGLRSGERDLYQFGNLGTYPLLARLAEGPELATFVESELGPLFEHDAANNAKLLPTLRAYLDNAGRKSDTVNVLRIQRRTLYARLARIERQLGHGVDDQDARTRLTLALQGLDILGDRTRSHRPRSHEVG